jgi:hypothetical protein
MFGENGAVVRTDSIDRSLGADDGDEHLLTFPVRINDNQEIAEGEEYRWNLRSP